MIIAGIDPGQKGSIAMLDTEENKIAFDRLPYKNTYQNKPELMATKFLDALVFIEPDVIVLEQVSAMPKQGLSSTFKFGQNFGEVLALTKYYIEYNSGRNIRFERIRPAEWKRKLGLAGKPKSASKSFILSKFPIYDNMREDDADAACIALYYQEKYLTK